MKSAIILSGLLCGYFLPYHAFPITLFLIILVISFILGFVLPDMMNANSLRKKADREKITFKNTISISNLNTLSLWAGVFVFCASITGIIKNLYLISEVSQTGIVLLAFSAGIFIRLLRLK